MSKCTHNGQRYVELFSPTNKEILKTWKVLSSVNKVYDERIKTFVYILKGKAPVPLMQWPKDKTNVVLDHPILVFQIFLAVGASILFDIKVSCHNNLRKRITVSTNQKTSRITSLSITLPLSVKNAGTWSHLIVDVEDAVSSVWKRESFQSIESISLSGACSVRKIFTLRRDMLHNEEGGQFIKYDQMPKQMLLSRNDSPIYTIIPCLDDCQREETKSVSSSLTSQLVSSPSSSKSSGHFKVAKRACSRRSISKSARSSGSISETISSRSEYECYYKDVKGKDRIIEHNAADHLLPFLSSLSFGDALAEEVSSNQDLEVLSHSDLEMSGNTFGSKYSFYHEDVRRKDSTVEQDDKWTAEPIL